MPRRLCLLVPDYYNYSVLRFDAGDGTFIDEFVPPSAELAFPMSVAVGPQGDIYVPSYNLALTEMDLPWPDWQYVPRPPWATAIGVNLWLIAIGVILGALAALLFRIWPKPWPTR